MATQNQKIHGIIHTAALSAAAVGAGMAQVPGSDAPVIAGIQTTMIIAIGREHSVELTKQAAANLLLPFFGFCRRKRRFSIPGWLDSGLG